MNLLFCCTPPPVETSIEWGKMFVELIPQFILILAAFLLGLYGSKLRENKKENKRLEQIQDIINLHLKETILEQIEPLVKDYEECKSVIRTQCRSDSDHFVSFNGYVFESVDISDLFKMNPEKFNALNSIYSSINFASLNTPLKIYDAFYNETINIKVNSSKYLEYVDYYITIIDMRIESAKSIDTAIKEYLY